MRTADHFPRARVIDIAHGIDSDNRADRHALRQGNGRAADTAVLRDSTGNKFADRCTGTGTDTPLHNALCSGHASGTPHHGIGPYMCLTHTQIIQHGGRDNGNDGIAHIKADTHLLQIAHDTARRFQAKGTAARQHDRVSAFDQIAGS